MLFYPGCSEDMTQEAAFMERLGRCEGMKLMKTQGRRIHLSEGTGSAKALRLGYGVRGLLWEKQGQDLNGWAEVGERRRRTD